MPVMLGDAKLAGEMAQRLLAHGIYVIGFSFPVVPKGQARIRVQLSAAHSTSDVDRAIAAFATVGERARRGSEARRDHREDPGRRSPTPIVELQDLTGTADHWKASHRLGGVRREVADRSVIAW